LTHPHRDHCGGAASVLMTMPVDTVYVARASFGAEPYVTMREAAPEVPWRGLAAGDRVQLAPGYVAEVLWPPTEDVLDSGANGVSLVLWAAGDGVPDLLMMGDLEADGEALLLQRARAALEARSAEYLVLKVGHHGSRTSSTPDFLDAIDAELGIVSVGRLNRYGHPAPETLAALRMHGCTALRTDAGGAIRVQQRGRTLWLQRPGEPARAVAIPNERFAEPF